MNIIGFCVSGMGGKEKVIYKVRVGDILLAENKICNQTNIYLVVNLDGDDGFGLICLSCGSKVGFYGNDKEEFKKDIDGFLNVKYIVPKEKFCEFFNKNYKLRYKIMAHDVINERYELGIEIERET